MGILPRSAAIRGGYHTTYMKPLYMGFESKTRKLILEKAPDLPFHKTVSSRLGMCGIDFWTSVLFRFVENALRFSFKGDKLQFIGLNKFVDYFVHCMTVHVVCLFCCYLLHLKTLSLCFSWRYCSFIIRMTPLLNKHSETMRNNCGFFILISVFKKELRVWLFDHGSVWVSKIRNRTNFRVTR